MKPRRNRAILRLSLLVSTERTCNLYKLSTHRKLHRFLVSNAATDAVKFILDRMIKSSFLTEKIVLNSIQDYLLFLAC